MASEDSICAKAGLLRVESAPSCPCCRGGERSPCRVGMRCTVRFETGVFCETGAVRVNS